MADRGTRRTEHRDVRTPVRAPASGEISKAAFLVDREPTDMLSQQPNRPGMKGERQMNQKILPHTVY